VFPEQHDAGVLPERPVRTHVSSIVHGDVATRTRVVRLVDCWSSVWLLVLRARSHLFKPRTVLCAWPNRDVRQLLRDARQLARLRLLQPKQAVRVRTDLQDVVRYWRWLLRRHAVDFVGLLRCQCDDQPCCKRKCCARFDNVDA
jgi:hypothetical protein